MAARFTQGDSIASTRSVKQEGRVPISRGSGKGKAGGMPGYIKTAQDKSSSGLASSFARRGRAQSGPRREGYIPTERGESRKNWQAASTTGGSQDKNYRATSTGRPGTIRVMGEPKAPATRSRGEMESGPKSEAGRKNAVSSGGVRGANKLPAGGIGPGKLSGHATMKGGQGSAKASGQGARARGGFSTDGRMSSVGSKAPPTAKGFIGGAKGTMESLRGRVNTTKSMGLGKRSGSQMY